MFPIVILVSFALHVLVLQLGAPMVGAKRPHLGRTVITCLLAPLFALAFGLVVGMPLGCLASVFGTVASVLMALAVGIAGRAILYAFLLEFSPTQSAILAAGTAVSGWARSGAACCAVLGPARCIALILQAFGA